MNLSDFCRRITGPDTRLLPENHKLGARLVCPEYSKSVQEVKTYPLLGQDRSFLLCWNFDSPGNLYATMMPSPENFCYHYSYSEGKYTQLHTHDYLELSYVVEGEFHQRILNKDVVFQKGDLCLIDKNCLHQDCLTDQSGVVLFIGIANDMFTEIMNENSTPQKILSFLCGKIIFLMCIKCSIDITFKITDLFRNRYYNSLCFFGSKASVDEVILHIDDN